MRNWLFGDRATRRAGLALLTAATLTGCGLDEKPNIPDFNGPSELGTAVRLTAVPDVVEANGYSRSEVTAEVRDQDGRAIEGKEIYFAITDGSGRTADIGDLQTNTFREVGTAVTVKTGPDGKARASYRSPYRTDATANQTVLLTARPVGDDFNGAVFRQVRISLRSAEPRLFPEIPGNTAPTCNFAVQAPNGFRPGVTILFQSTSSDADGAIVRYEWFYSDGGYEDAPDTAHVFARSGVQNVTHVVTDSGGLQSACAATLTLQ